MQLTSYTPPRFRFLFMKGTDYGSIAANGSVVFGANMPERGVKEPLDWKETGIKWARSQTYWGLMTTLTTAFKFVEDGAKILRHIYYNEGVEGVCKLVVQRRKKADFTYETFYEGDVDFSTFKTDNTTVSVNIKQGGLNALFRSNEDTPYEVTTTQEQILMDGVSMFNKSVMSVWGFDNGTTYMPAQENIYNESPIAPSTQNQVRRSLEYDLLIKGYPFFVARQDTSVTVGLELKLRLEQATNMSQTGANTPPYNSIYKIILGRYHPVYQTLNYYTLFSGTVINLLDEDTIINTGYSFGNIIEGETLSFFGAVCDANGDFITGQGGGNTVFDVKQIFTGSVLKVSYYTRLPETTAAASRYHQVVSALMGALSNGQAVMNMPFLTSPATVSEGNRPFNTWLATTEEVRGITGSKFKLKFSDLFQDMSGRWLLGMGIVDNTATIAPLAEFFQDVMIADLGDVKDFEVVPATDLLFSDLKLGMKTNSDDSLNGRNEIISAQTWKAPLVRTDNTRDASSSFIGGMFSIEKIRNDRNKESTNTTPDNDVVVLETEATQTNGQYKLYRISHNNVSGPATLVRRTAYNLMLRPRADLLRNAPLIAMVCHNLDSVKTVTFQTAEREGNLSMKVGSVFVDDRSPLPVGSLGTPPFLPIRFRFTTAMPDNLYQLLNTTPYGYFRFWDKGIAYKGFVDEMGQRTADDAAVECSLLAHPQTNLTTLIR